MINTSRLLIRQFQEQDYSAFASSPDDAIGLLVDMVTLAKCDGTFHITEKMFVKQVGKLLGFSDNDIDETMATTG